jgi:hypothetical protein
MVAMPLPPIRSVPLGYHIILSPPQSFLFAPYAGMGMERGFLRCGKRLRNNGRGYGGGKRVSYIMIREREVS